MNDRASPLYASALNNWAPSNPQSTQPRETTPDHATAQLLDPASHPLHSFFCATASNRTTAHNIAQAHIQQKFGASAAQEYSAAFVLGPGSVWPQNFEIHVSFSNGTKRQIDAVKAVMTELNGLLNITFVTVKQGGHVRVDFNTTQTSYSSSVGPQGADENAGQFVRVTIGWLDAPDKDPSFLDADGRSPNHGVIKHEFGHVLGLEHECACIPKQLMHSNKNFWYLISKVHHDRTYSHRNGA